MLSAQYCTPRIAASGLWVPAFAGTTADPAQHELNWFKWQ
jgi:hypothetical protein